MNLLNELVTIDDNGHPRTMTKREAVMLTVLNKAITGDLRAAREVFWEQIPEAWPEQSAPPTALDRHRRHPASAFMQAQQQLITTSMSPPGPPIQLVRTAGPVRLRVPFGQMGDHVSPDGERVYTYGGTIRLITVDPRDVDWFVRHGFTRV